MRARIALCAATAASLLALAAGAAENYVDSRKRQITFPLGAASFADEVVAHVPGKPPVRDARWSQPDLLLGPPNYAGPAAERVTQTSLTLGCGGSVTVRFVDNALVDVEGPDLYVFEVGPAIEATHVEISTDGTTWIDAGRIAGGAASTDISPVATAGAAFHYVRLTDLRRGCGGPFPGADIDAIGAIGSALALTLAGAVLFDSGQSTLKPEAQAALETVAARIREVGTGAVEIKGHTDSVGSDAANQALSEARAKSVAAFLASIDALKGMIFTSAGFGESRPIASNDSDEGRARNRRVEILVTPQTEPQ